MSHYNKNSDHFDIQAYLVNTANNNGNNARTVTMLNTTAASGSGTATGTVGTTGNYKLVIVSGAFDNDGDRDSSSTVTIDNVSVSAITDDVLDIIKNNISYENLNFAASNASYTPQVSITSVTGGGSSASESINVPATLAGFSLTGGSNEEVISTGEVTILSSNSFSLSQQDNSTNGTTFWESSAGTIETLQLLSGSNPVTSDSALRIQNAAERVSLAIKNVTNAKEKGLLAYRSQFEFGDFDTSNYLDSLNTTKAEAIEPVVAQNLTQKTAKMIIADEIQGLLAKMGNASADDVYALLRST